MHNCKLSDLKNSNFKTTFQTFADEILVLRNRNRCYSLPKSSWVCFLHLTIPWILDSCSFFHKRYIFCNAFHVHKITNRLNVAKFWRGHIKSLDADFCYKNAISTNMNITSYMKIFS